MHESRRKAMKIYGVKYEDHTDGLDSWVDNDVYKTQAAALRTAEQCANCALS